jgi:para-nitrobenzyl esterase
MRGLAIGPWCRFVPGVALALAVGACSAAPERPEADPTSLRTLALGEVVGFTGSYGSHVWLGLPYAQPPVGELRWRAPRPPEPWQGRREALAYGAVCPQFPSVAGGVEGDPETPVGDEDCLTLAVHAPRREAAALPGEGQRWPVMVWIHGGGNSVGEVRPYDGGVLAQRHDVVVVAVQYRLGPLGWLRHASLRAGDATPQDASGNYGTLDLIRALEWVRDNVAAFGGDPRNVTIFGESAGGRDVLSLLAAPAAAGLFHRAISQSGSSTSAPLFEAENLVDDAQPGWGGSSGELVLRLLRQDDRASTREEAKRVASAMAPAELASYLRGKSASEILLAWRGESERGPRFPNVFPDGAVLPSDGLLAAYARPAGHARVPVMLGTNRDEQRLFQLLNPQLMDTWFGIVFRVRNLERYLALADAVSRTWKVSGADGPAQALASNQPDVYVYRFDWDEEPSILGAEFSKLVGAGHGVELPFVFGHGGFGALDRLVFTDENAAGREALSGVMMSYWTEFARSGKPGRGRDGTLPEWLAWDPAPGAPKALVLDTPQGATDVAAGGTPDVALGSGSGVRMLNEALTHEAVVAGVERDPRYADLALRCAALLQMGYRGALDAAGYAERCPDYPAPSETPE